MIFTRRMVNVLLLALVSVAGYGGTDDNGRYAVEKIPPSLRKGADAVVRLRHLRFEVKDSRYASQIVTEAVTIFDRDRSDLGRWVQTYDDHIDIEDIQGTLYDAQGNEVRRLDDDDISDYSAISGFSIYEDTRVKRAKLMAAQVPYTVEYRYEISYDGFINWPFWVAQKNDYPVERTRFEVLLPSSKRLRYWCNVDTLPPTITTTGGSTLYSWEATNLPQLTSNWATENAYDVTIVVRIAPHEFEIEGTRGDMSTWKSFGQWCYGLYRNRDRLPPGAHQEVLQRIASCLTDRDKVFALYDHFQSKTRYVSVQLGLGSWQPYDATYVYERGYGDCKALTNYMMALLKAAGIRSHPVLIDPGERRYPMIVDFPNNQFTHVILCVPSESDTIWLECTSQSFPAGHIGRGNDNLYALLLTEEGGKVIRTPASRSSENTQLRVGVAELQQTGNAHARVYMTYAGCQRDRVHGALDNRSPEEQQRWLIQSLDIAHGNLDHYEIGNLATRDPKFSLMLELSLPRFATSTGNRLFFYPGAMERQTWVPPESKDRRSILIVSEYAYMDSDSIVYKIPSTYTVEALPAAVQLETSFGSFTSSTEPAGENLLVFRRRVEIRTPQIPAAHYDECRNFFAEVAKSDRSQVVLVRKASR